jgi:uncharacterized membrane protein YgaE (UPF0421/DUF939 family)
MKREYTKTELGMMYGMLVGAVIALTLFSLTGQAWWLAMSGVGLAFGLGLGATWERRGG